MLVALEDHCRDVSTWYCRHQIAGCGELLLCSSGDRYGCRRIVREVRCAGTTVMVVESVKEPTVGGMVVAPAARMAARPLLSMLATEVVEEVQVISPTRSWTEPSL